MRSFLYGHEQPSCEKQSGQLRTVSVRDVVLHVLTVIGVQIL